MIAGMIPFSDLKSLKNLTKNLFYDKNNKNPF